MRRLQRSSQKKKKSLNAELDVDTGMKTSRLLDRDVSEHVEWQLLLSLTGATFTKSNAVNLRFYCIFMTIKHRTKQAALSDTDSDKAGPAV